MSIAHGFCRAPRRRQLVRASQLNGIDSIDVVGSHLCVRFLTGIPAEFLPKKGARPGARAQVEAQALAHIVIKGGRRVTGIRAIALDPDESPSRYDEGCLGIDLDKEGDWSTYTLCFVETKNGRPTEAPLKSLDERYACAEFTFKTDCPAELDCRTGETCTPEPGPAPPVSYLAKDYATFRRLILDRLALTMPQWRERHVPDVGIMLTELLAYVADDLSSFQDAVGTEQYLHTARRRISVRRHARLVDYLMHDGCNARAFLALQAGADSDAIPREDVYFITRTSGGPGLRHEEVGALPGGWLAFEPMGERPTLKLRVAHNAIRIYTWADEECCLPKASTRATLLDEIDETTSDPDICDERPWPPEDHCHDDKCQCGRKPPPPVPPRPLSLEPGDFLIFEEVACAGTSSNTTMPAFGEPPLPDADRTHRHVVRLTRVSRGCDRLLGKRVLEVEWGREDALPFPLCVSAIGAPPECDLVRNLAVVRGNVVLVDHGTTIRDEPLPTVDPRHTDDHCEAEDAPAELARVAARYRPRLRQAPLTFAQPLAPDVSATAALSQDPRAALPALSLAAIPPSADGATPLFSAAQLANVERTAGELFDPASPALVALRRRLRKAVRALIDKKKVTGELLTALEDNLRDLTDRWDARRDLLDSGPDDPVFVAEVDDSGFAELRFGDGDAGRALDVGMTFVATYRAGNGRAGAVGPESIVHVVFRKGQSQVITAVRNPLAAAGAVDPEPTADVKQYAPGAFRKPLERAVTAADYASLARYLRYPTADVRIQSASAALRWSGSWYEAAVALDPAGTSDLDPALRSGVEQRLHRYRRMGHDLRVGAAGIVPLRLELDLCVKPEYLRAHVTAAVRDALGSRVLRGGGRGFFHPDNLTFGAAVHVSRIVAAVMAVEGVAEVHVVRLERLARKPHDNPDLPQGLLKLRPNEIARLDNDPAVPENGVLGFLNVRGGR